MMKPTRSWTTGLGLKTLATLLLSTLLISCGSSKKYDEFMPTRIISIGDALSYADFSYGATVVNPVTSIDPATGKTDHWLMVYAAAYGLTQIGATATGSNNLVYLNNDTYLRSGCPSIASPYKPNSTSSLSERCSLGNYAYVSGQLTALPTAQSGDLVVISFGMGDVFKKADDVASGLITLDKALQDASDLGLSYINLADRVYQLGFKHVLVMPTLDYSSSPYAATQSATYRDNLTKLTQALILGANRNCNGGCAVGDNKPYPSRAEGVWNPNLSNWLQNVVLYGGSYGYPKAIINNNTSSGTPTSPLCLYPTLLSDASCAPNNSLTDSSNYPFFYSGDLFMTPSLHRIVGNFVYAYSRGTIGF